MTRAPISQRDLGQLAELGDVILAYIDHGEDEFSPVRFPEPRPMMLWSEPAQAIVWWEGLEEAPPEEVSRWNASQRAWLRWTRGRYELSYERNQPIPTLRGAWRDHGWIDELHYWSDKFGRSQEYWHPFDSDVRIWSQGGGRHTLWVVRGGDLRLTRGGIEG